MGDVIIDIDDLLKTRDKLEKLTESEISVFHESCSKELAARFLKAVVKVTPVGQYPNATGKKGGNLRRGWTSFTPKVHRTGETYTVEIINPVEYASYVEIGHRQQPGRYVPAIGKRLKKGWIPGKHFMKDTEELIKENAPSILENKINTFLGGIL